MVGTLNITCVPVLRDNYVWMLHCQVSGEVAVVDPAVSEPILDICAQRGSGLQGCW